MCVCWIHCVSKYNSEQDSEPKILQIVFHAMINLLGILCVWVSVKIFCLFFFLIFWYEYRVCDFWLESSQAFQKHSSVKKTKSIPVSQMLICKWDIFYFLLFLYSVFWLVNSLTLTGLGKNLANYKAVHSWINDHWSKALLFKSNQTKFSVQGKYIIFVMRKGFMNLLHPGKFFFILLFTQYKARETLKVECGANLTAVSSWVNVWMIK